MAVHEATRKTGVVSRFSKYKGYGFIKLDDGTNQHLFVHQTQTEIKSDGYSALHEGLKVAFTVALNGKRYQAVNVTVLNGAPLSGDNGGGSNGGGKECYRCRKIGHMARDCDRKIPYKGQRVAKDDGKNEAVDVTATNGSGNGNIECYRCRKIGHIARDCDRNIPYNGERVAKDGGKNEAVGVTAINGSGTGGGNDSNGGSSGGCECYRCRKIGHIARDCDRNIPYKGERVAKDGGKNEAVDVTASNGSGTDGGNDSSDDTCHYCGESGHFARECPSRENKCYHCGDDRHFSRECPYIYRRRNY